MARTVVRSKASKARAGTRPDGKQPDLPKVYDRVLKWFDEHGRSFPWREHRDPYQTLVAEVMLQQTQTGRVAPAYGTFLAKFPDVRTLAHAPAMEVIQAWRGLGYNRRAVDLQRSAQVIEHEQGGVIPSDPKALRALPGVGEYSATTARSPSWTSTFAGCFRARRAQQTSCPWTRRGASPPSGLPPARPTAGTKH
jgi:adenine-specific DNA glycosylase